MANENQVTITVAVDANEAAKLIEQFGSRAIKTIEKCEESTKSFKDSFKQFGAPVVAAQAVFQTAFAAISKTIALFSETIKEATQEQRQFLQIAAALKSTGEATDSATKSIVEFAEALEEATGVGDELAKQLFIDAKAFGISTEEAKKLTKASIDYAAATGIEAETAARQLGMTLDGTVGKLANLGFEFRNLTEEELKNGKAIDLIVQRYGGAASEQMNTFEGATKNVSNAFSDLQKGIGGIITQSPALIELLQKTAGALNFVADLVVQSGFKKAGEIIKDEQAKKTIAQLELIGNSSKEASVQFKELFTQSDKASSSMAAFSTFGEKLANTEIGEKKIGLTGKALEEFNKQLAKTREETKKLSEGILGSFGSEIEKVSQKMNETITKINEQEKIGLDKGGLSQKEALKLRTLVVEDYGNNVKKILQDIEDKDSEGARKAAEAFKKSLDQRKEILQKERDKTAAAGSDPFSAIAGEEGLSVGQASAAGVGILNNILKGAEGAVTLVSKGIGQVADIFLPGIGGAVGELAGLLARGPEATKMFIKQFVEAVPDIVTAIAESAPVVVEALVDSLILKGGIVRIAAALARALSGQAIFVAIGKQIGVEIGAEAAKPYADAAKQAGEDAKNFQKQFAEDFKRFFREIGPATGAALLAVFPTIQSGLSETFARSGLVIAQGFQQFAAQLGSFFSGFTESLKGFTDVFENLGNSLRITFEPLTKGVQDLASSVNGLLQPIQDLISALKGGKGGGKGLLSESLGGVTDFINKIPGVSAVSNAIDKIPGFAGGTDFVQGPGGTDRVPALLTQGERVVPVDTNVALTKFLSQQSSPSGSDNAMLTQILSMVSQPMVVKTEAKVNQSAFADIILQLNRQNARLSA